MSDEDELENLSHRLASADFSAESRIRNSLRAALLSKGRATAPRRLPISLVAFAATALAALALLLARPRTTAPVPPAASDAATAARTLPEPFRPAAARRRAPAPGLPKDALGLPILPGRFAARGSAPEPSPLSSRAVAGIFVTRPVTLGDIFVRRTL